jgi:large subunit ribosomal protein L15
MNIAKLKKIQGSRRRAKRVGRGAGSGKGSHTSGNGNKGQKARTGNKVLTYFEGGQTPITKRLPFIRGFKNKNAKSKLILNISDLSGLFEKADVINKALLVSEGYVTEHDLSSFHAVKILSKGNLTKKISFEGFEYSESAKEKIEKSGGKAN